jgi:hypothetical protein
VGGYAGRVALVPVNTATCKTTHTHYYLAESGILYYLFEQQRAQLTMVTRPGQHHGAV